MPRLNRLVMGLTHGYRTTGRSALSGVTVRDWEQGRNQPDHAARALLKVIEFDPELVQQALVAKPDV